MSVRFTVTMDDDTYNRLAAVKNRTGRSLSDQVVDFTRPAVRREVKQLGILEEEVSKAGAAEQAAKVRQPA